MDTYFLKTFSKTREDTWGLKLAVSMEAACSNLASPWGSVGTSFVPWLGYLASMYRAIARLSNRTKPSSSCRKQNDLRDQRKIAESRHLRGTELGRTFWRFNKIFFSKVRRLRGNSRLFFKVLWGLVFALRHIDWDKFIFDTLFLEDDCNCASAGRSTHPVEFQYHC